jgi:hypothetical protein
MNHPSPQSDLPLLALRYTAGELDAAELAAFERRLETDLVAQSALVQAVQIVAVLQSPSRLPAITRPLSSRPAAASRQWSRWLAVLSCGVVAAAMLIALREESVPDAGGDAVAGTAAGGAMVADWAAVELADAEVLSADDAALLVLDEDPSGEDVVPDWLLAAVEMSDSPPAADDADAAPGSRVDSIDEET